MRITSFTLLLIVLGVPLARSGEEPEPKPLDLLFEERVGEADWEGVRSLLRSRPYEVIYLVDGYLESWLKQMEAPETERDPNAGQILERALLAARHADETFGGDAYSRYAKAWKGWSADERVRFRAGQAAFYRGRDAQKAKQYDDARAAYEESLSLAKPLGDLWGIAQAEQALGDLAVGDEKLEEALRRHEAARDVFASIRHQRMLRSCHALGVIHERLGHLKEARANYERMIEAAKEVDRDVDTAAVRQSLIRVCRAMGDDEAAERLEVESGGG